MDFWHCRQIHDFLCKLSHKLRASDSLNEFETRCDHRQDSKLLLSQMYTFLLGLHTHSTLYFIQEWETDLAISFTSTKIHKIPKLTHASSISTRTQESCYRFFPGGIKHPSHLARYFLGMDSRCWSGFPQKGAFIHLWWYCPKIQKFWQEISTLRPVDFSPLPYLFHTTPTSLKS